MKIFFFICLIFSATITFAKETFLDCSIQGKKTFLSNRISEEIISPSKASVKISETKNVLFIFIEGPNDESTSVATYKLKPNDSYENLSSYSEYHLIYVSKRDGLLRKEEIIIDRASGAIKIEKDFNLGSDRSTITSLYGSCRKIDKLKF